MTRIVTTHYRYKRPPRKKQALALDVPAIVMPKTKPKLPTRVDTTPTSASPAIVTKGAREAVCRRARHDARGAPASRRCRRRPVARTGAPGDQQKGGYRGIMGELESDISWNMRRVILAFGPVLAAWETTGRCALDRPDLYMTGGLGGAFDYSASAVK
jgi:hypothetical protein